MIRRRIRSALSGLCFASCLAACGMVPMQTVLPYPDHILAALSVGDAIEITTDDGNTVHGTVTALTARVVGIDGVAHDVDDIQSVRLRSFAAPANPCDDDRPLGCSVPALARIASDAHDRFADYFRPSCRQHDYCYRFGTPTYGFDRSDCDGRFLDAMRAQCSERANLEVIGRAECLLAARHFYNAVAEHGEASFLGARGKYCEYAGPRSAVVDR